MDDDIDHVATNHAPCLEAFRIDRPRVDLGHGVVAPIALDRSEQPLDMVFWSFEDLTDAVFVDRENAGYALGLVEARSLGDEVVDIGVGDVGLKGRDVGQSYEIFGQTGVLVALPI